MKYLLLLFCLVSLGCQAVEVALPSRKAIAELKYAGDRPDAPPLAERGNATFTAATYDDTGSLLITQAWFGSARLQVWNATDGTLISGFDAFPPSPGSHQLWMVDSKRRRLLAHTGNNNDQLVLFDLMTGQIISKLPYEPNEKKVTVGLLDDGNRALFFRPGAMEVWQVDPPQLVLEQPSPFTTVRYMPTCTGGIPATYNEKNCWEWSADRKTLAVAFTPEEPVQATTEYMLIDTTTLGVTRIALPEMAGHHTFASFAFSPDGRWLAVGTTEELFLYDRIAKEWRPAIPGHQRRNNILGPMRFTSDSARVIALGDEFQINVFDVATGAQVGRTDQAFETVEGELKVSLDGSRMVAYKFLSDTFEILDGANAKHVGWVCPYFCNIAHNPNQPPYAVSPDGKSVAISHRRGTAVWDTATDQIKFPLKDPKKKPLPYPMQQ